MPLTDDGFLLPTRDDIYSYIVDQAKKYLGDDIDVSPGSRMGMLVDAWADDRLQLEQTAQDVYDANFNATATGVSLDRRASNYGTQRYQAQYASVTLTITGQAGYVVPADTEFDTDNGDAFYTDVDCQLDDTGVGTVLARSEDASASYNVDANTIVDQAVPVDEITSVTNQAAASGGADLETDYELRQRLIANADSSEGPTDSGIKTAVLNVPGVTSCYLVDNRTENTDSYGNPPHTCHLYVLGGDPNDVADKLAVTIGAGTTMVGDQVFDRNIGGSVVEVRFDTAQNVTLTFKIDLDISSGYDQGAVNQSVEDFIDGYEMGDDIVINKLYGELYDLSGVSRVNSIQASKDGQNWVTTSLQLNHNESAVTQDDQIEVTTHD